MQFLSILVLAFLFAAPVVRAQERVAPGLRLGTRIKFTLYDDRVDKTGTVVAIGDTSVVVRVDRSELLTTVILDSIASLAIGRPRSVRAGAGNGAWIGFRVGAVLAVLATTAVWLSDADENCNDCFIPATPAIAVLGVLGTGVLTVGGAVLGAAAPGEIWGAAPSPSRRASFFARDRRLILTVRFTGSR